MNSSGSTVYSERSPSFIINYLPHNWSWFATTRSTPQAAPPEGGTTEVRSAARHKQHATEQLFTKSHTNILKQIYLVCNDTILTSSGSARGGYMEVRSAARHKQHATEPLFTKSPTNILKQICLVCNDTILTSSGSASGGYMEVRSAARHKQQATEQLLTKNYTNDLKHWGRL